MTPEQQKAGLVDATKARAALFAAVAPFVEYVDQQHPGLPDAARLVVGLQAHPLIVRAFVERMSDGPLLEVARKAGAEVPGAGELEAAIEAFLMGGMSAIPAEAVALTLETAWKRGGGYIVLLDSVTGSARALLALPGKDLSEAVELFSLQPEHETTTLH